MGRPKGEKKNNSIFARRQNDLKIMCGAVETYAPKPFNPNFMDNVENVNEDIDPLERMTREELESFIESYELYSGKEFDDPGVAKRYFGRGSQLVLGLIDGRRLIYLNCIYKIQGITIEEFLTGVISPTRKNQVAYTEAIELLSEWMYAGLVKNHRLTPEEGDTGRRDYSIHGEKKLEITDEGKLLLSRIESIIFTVSPLMNNQINNAVVRREMLIKKLRRDKKEEIRKNKSLKFSKETYDTIAKMKELLGNK